MPIWSPIALHLYTYTFIWYGMERLLHKSCYKNKSSRLLRSIQKVHACPQITWPINEPHGIVSLQYLDKGQ